MSNVAARIKRLFRLRFAVLYPLGVYLIFFTTPDETTTLAGIAFMVAGLVMRLWSNGYAIKLEKLTTSGPYAFLRNPLYLGTGLIILGVTVMLNILVVGVVFFGVLAAVYTRTIRNEERMLTDKFGAAYLDYRSKVPAMWPTFSPYAGGDKWPFSFDRVWFSREHKLTLWVSIIVIAFHVKKEFMAVGVDNKEKIAWMIAAAGVLACLDLLGEYVRGRLAQKGP